MGAASLDKTAFGGGNSSPSVFYNKKLSHQNSNRLRGYFRRVESAGEQNGVGQGNNSGGGTTCEGVGRYGTSATSIAAAKCLLNSPCPPPRGGRRLIPLAFKKIEGWGS